MQACPKVGCILGGCLLVLQLFFPGSAQALFTINETKIFSSGPYAFKVEIQVNGNGNFKKPPVSLTSIKIKIKNDRASSDVLKVKAIRAYLSPDIFQDIETAGFPVTPGQWVTKFYRLSKGKRPLLTDKSHIQISFDGFSVQFFLRERRFQGPAKTAGGEKASFPG